MFQLDRSPRGGSDDGPTVRVVHPDNNRYGFARDTGPVAARSRLDVVDDRFRADTLATDVNVIWPAGRIIALAVEARNLLTEHAVFVAFSACSKV